MKVLHVIPSVAPSYGGPARAIIEIERSLSALGVEVTTISTNDNGPNSKLPVQCGVPILSEHATRIYFSTQGNLYRVSISMALWLNTNLKNYEIVHAHSLFCFPPVIAGYLARQKRIPYILRPLGVLAKYGMTQRRAALKALSVALVERRLIQSAAAIHFTSLAEQTEAEHFGLAGRGIVVPLGISGTGPEEENASRSLSAGNMTILFLSRLDPKKNVESLLEAFAMLKRERPNLTLTIAGDGRPAYTDTLKSLAINLGVASSVNWLGHINGSGKAEQLSGATVFVLPSFSENFGIAVVEALACGLPCVVSAGVAISSAVERTGAGVVTGTDAASIAAGIRQVLCEARVYQTMSRAAYELAAREFSSEAMGTRLLELYTCIKSGRTYPRVSVKRQSSHDLDRVRHTLPR
jgi:glycosyltransferase involved in cell wall biosynthesis